MDLKTYLTTDPDNLGFAPLIESGNDSEIASRINALGKIKTQEISGYIPYQYLVKRLLWRPIVEVSNNPAHPVHAAATVAVDLIATGGNMPVNLADPDAAPIFAGLVAAGLLSTSHRDELIAMCTTPASYGEARGFNASIHNLDVARALGRNGFGG